MKSIRLSLLPLLALAVMAVGCDTSSTTAISTAFGGTVTGPDGEAVSGATVWLVTTASINTLPITSADMRDLSSSDRDEPLEDAVRNSGSTLAKVVTDAAGGFSFTSVADGDYYIYVAPAAASEYLPGGTWCRDSVNASGLRGNTAASIVLSSSPSATATYTGMTTCLSCHEDHASEKGVAHRLGFTVPNTLSSLQSGAEHPELFDGNSYFAAVNTAGGEDFTFGTPVYMWDPDFTRGFDDFQTSLTDPTSGGGTVYAIIWLWIDSATGKYMLTIENKVNPAPAIPFVTREVKLNYGGGVKKQRFMIDWAGRNGLYNILQYQTDGDESRYDRTRKQFRDYHLDHYWNNQGTTADGTDDEIKDPSIGNNINLKCMGCHATGYTQYLDGTTGEVLCDSVEDPGGEYDIDGDGMLNDVNNGCETCHGPGSEHVAAETSGRFIVTPNYITSSREVQICIRCHDRLTGNASLGAPNDTPLTVTGQFPLPGISRDDFLTNYLTVTGAKASTFWPDDIHSKSHHLQGPDFVKSVHYRNGTTLLSCTACHDLHGGTGNPSALSADPDDPAQPLCLPCHQADIVDTATHTTKVIGVAHGTAVARCIDCHMTKTAKTGSGDYGFLMAAPTGTSADTSNIYFENDITSHFMDVPRKTNIGVSGISPDKAMPIPYTKACGTCHDPSSLQF